MISSTAEYALRAVVHLASGRGAAATTQQIAAATRVPAGYLSKVLQDLTKAGILNSQRGPRGGFTLARDAASVSVLEVINSVDPIRRILRCPLGIPSHGSKLCELHQKLDDAIAAVEEVFRSSSIADLVPETSRSAAPRCVFPTVNGVPPARLPTIEPGPGASIA